MPIGPVHPLRRIPRLGSMSDPDPSAGFREVSFSASSIWRLKYWILAGLILGWFVGVGFVFAQPETHRSWSQVLVRPLGVDLTRGPVNLNNALDIEGERELAGSFLVAERASEKIEGGPDARTLRRGLDVTTVQGSAVLEFSWAESDPTSARDVTQALADSYLEIRSEVSNASFEASRAALDELRTEILADRAQLILFRGERAIDDDDRLIALAEEAALTSQLAQLSNDIAVLDSLTTDPGLVISPAQLATSSERPRAVPLVLSGALLGGLLGALAGLFFKPGD